MIEARIIDAITPLTLCAAFLILAALLLSEDRRLRPQARTAVLRRGRGELPEDYRPVINCAAWEADR